MSEQRFVLPGEEIGTEEEFVAGSGTYVEEARIFAAVAGRLAEENHTLSVAGAPALHAPRIACWASSLIRTNLGA